MPASPGLSAIELFEQMQSGKIRALWIACTNPAQSLPDQNRIKAALEQLTRAAREEDIPYQVSVFAATTPTDANAMQVSSSK